jgi:hypothetical protein
MPRKGWVFIETVAAMLLLAFLATVLAVGINRQQTALMHLRNSRAALHLAEATLSDRSFPAPPDGRIARHPLTASSRPSSGLVWIKVTATVDGRSAELVGLSPTGGQP